MANSAGDFNPRSPRGERQELPQNRTTRLYFNPRSPRGERRKGIQPRLNSLYFNPRSPRGERRCAVPRRISFLANFNPRSPRGERLFQPTARKCSQEFQSTLPARGATIAVYHGVAYLIISIHAPREGSDSRSRKSCKRSSISIHAPREGSDCAVEKGSIYLRNFNPRSPRGERRRTVHQRSRRRDYFNPRSPRGERLNTCAVRWSL